MNPRLLELDDYQKGFLQLLTQLTKVGNSSFIEFKKQFLAINSHIYVIEDTTTKQIIATGSIFIEKKFIHNNKSVGHIEDIVVDTHYRNSKLGTKIILFLIDIAKKNNCYKIILNCHKKLLNFYKKIGFTSNQENLSMYIDTN